MLIKLILEKNPRYIEIVRRDSALEDVLMEIMKDRVDEKVNTAVDMAVNSKEQQMTVTHINDIMKNLKLTVEQAMDALSIPQSKRSIYAGHVDKTTQYRSNSVIGTKILKKSDGLYSITNRIFGAPDGARF